MVNEHSMTSAQSDHSEQNEPRSTSLYVWLQWHHRILVENEVWIFIFILWKVENFQCWVTVFQIIHSFFKADEAKTLFKDIKAASCYFFQHCYIVH